MNEWMENKTDKYIANFLFNVIMALNIVAYLGGSFKRPKPIP